MTVGLALMLHAMTRDAHVLADFVLDDAQIPYTDQSEPGVLEYNQDVQRLLDRHAVYHRWVTSATCRTTSAPTRTRRERARAPRHQAMPCVVCGAAKRARTRDVGGACGCARSASDGRRRCGERGVWSNASLRAKRLSGVESVVCR